MASSWVEICNLALIELGSNTIAQFDESTNGRLCGKYYRQAVDEVLTEHEFACAEKRQALNSLAEDPEDENWSYQYQLPVDHLKTRGVSPDSPYDESGGVILSNEDELTLIYTYQVTDPKLLKPHVVNAIAWNLAHKLSPKIQQKSIGRTDYEAKAERALLKARWAERKTKRSTSQVSQQADADLLGDQSLSDRWEEVH